MTKKDFKELVHISKYTGCGRERDETAIFFDWFSGNGYKYCINAYTRLASREQLLGYLLKIVQGKMTEDQLPYYIVLTVAETDEQRFKVPLMGRGLNNLIKR